MVAPAAQQYLDTAQAKATDAYHWLRNHPNKSVFALTVLVNLYVSKKVFAQFMAFGFLAGALSKGLHGSPEPVSLGRAVRQVVPSLDDTDEFLITSVVHAIAFAAKPKFAAMLSGFESGALLAHYFIPLRQNGPAGMGQDPANNGGIGAGDRGGNFGERGGVGDVMNDGAGLRARRRAQESQRPYISSTGEVVRPGDPPAPSMKDHNFGNTGYTLGGEVHGNNVPSYRVTRDALGREVREVLPEGEQE